MFCANCGEKVVTVGTNFCNGCEAKLVRDVSLEKVRGSFTPVIPTTRTKRVLNLAFDYAGFYFFCYFVGHQAVLINPLRRFEKTSEWVVGISLFLLYYLIFESLWGKTPGKIITRTKVLTEDEKRSSFRAILIRTLARLIPVDPFTFFKPKHPRGWHDRLSKTVVVDDL